MSIYSCVTNVTLEMTSERHQSNNDLDLMIIKEHQRQHPGFAGVCLFQVTRPFALKFEMCYSERRLEDDSRQNHLYSNVNT